MVDLLKSLTVIVERLNHAVRSDPALRSELRKVAGFLYSITEDADGTAADQSAVDQIESPQPGKSEDWEPLATPISKPERSPVDLSKLDIGSLAPKEPTIQQQVEQYATPHADESKLPLVEKRLNMKAEGSRWNAKRSRLLESGADYSLEIEPQDQEIIRKAKLLESCFLWMNHPSCPTVEDHQVFERLGDCYEVVGSSVALLRRILADRDRLEGHLEPAMYLAAEAQSMLRRAVAEINTFEDTDQIEVFTFLKSLAFQQQTFITRHMRVDDPADPANAAELQERINAIDSEVDELFGSIKQRKARFNKIRYHIPKLSDTSIHDWNVILEQTALLVEEGMPPSNVELRDLLADLVDDIPEAVEVPTAAQQVLDSIDRYLSERTPSTDARVIEVDSPTVAEVANLLRGKSILMIGGTPRPHAKAALERAFELKELIWKKTYEHNTRLDCEPEISQPDLAVVLLAIRWVRHAYDDVKYTCEKYDTPFVRLPRGYNPNQVAEEILKQASEALRALR